MDTLHNNYIIRMNCEELIKDDGRDRMSSEDIKRQYTVVDNRVHLFCKNKSVS